jgi:hypothetical protein
VFHDFPILEAMVQLSQWDAEAPLTGY